MNWVSDAAITRLRAVANWPDFADTRYRVTGELGRGGMGTVFLGHDDALGRDVAIKVTHDAITGGPLEARMRAEAGILADLEHPGIVPIHDVGVLADGRLFTVMKLVRGVTLAEHLRGVASLDARLRVFERLCEPVAFAHARGTVHRDLKPGNVMIGSFGEVLVMDWGIAKTGDGRRETHLNKAPRVPDDGPHAGTDPGVAMGTRGYMAPEQARDAREVDARADVYSLGAMLFGMISDTGPPQDAAAARSDLARLSEAPKRLRAICVKAMSPEPVDRYADAGALATDLARLRNGMPVEAYPETAVDRLGRVAATYRTPILLVATYLLVRALIAVVFGR